VRTKDGAEVDFFLSEGDQLTHLIECKLSDSRPHRALTRFAQQFEGAQAVQLVRSLRQPEFLPPVRIERAATWLKSLTA
jgi:hypothetical protein